MEGMTYIQSPEDIYSKDDFQYADVECPEWGGKLMVRNATSLERDQWERMIQGLDGDPNRKSRRSEEAVKKRMTRDASRAFLVTKCTVNPSSKERFFKDTADVLRLAKKSSAPVTRLFNKIIELSKVTAEDLEELEEEFDDDPTSEPSTS
jgi:hypothetical protein